MDRLKGSEIFSGPFLLSYHAEISQGKKITQNGLRLVVCRLWFFNFAGKCFLTCAVGIVEKGIVWQGA